MVTEPHNHGVTRDPTRDLINLSTHLWLQPSIHQPHLIKLFASVSCIDFISATISLQKHLKHLRTEALRTSYISCCRSNKTARLTKKTIYRLTPLQPLLVEWKEESRSLQKESQWWWSKRKNHRLYKWKPLVGAIVSSEKDG